MNRSGKQNLAVVGLSLSVFILLILLLSTGGNRPQSSFQDKTSSYFTDSNGTKAIFLVLQELLPSAERWTKPLELLPPPERNNPTTLLVIGPTESLASAEAGALERWISRGGQLILAVQHPWPIQAETPDEGRPDSFLARHGFSLTSTGERPGALRKYDDPAGGLLLGGSALQAGEFTALFTDQLYIKGGKKLLESGRIVVIADRRVWSNDRLAASRNAVWLVSTVFSWGNGRLLIDEYHHGFQKTRSPFALILSFITSSWGLIFGQLALAGLLLLWLKARRFAAVIDPPTKRRQDPLSRVESLATLLATARATAFAFQSIHQLLVRRLWQLRFGALPARAQTAIERAISQSAYSEDYLSLLRRQDGGSAPSEAELLHATREAGKIIREYKSGR